MKKFKVFCEKLFEFLAQISSLVTAVSVVLFCLYMSTLLHEYGLIFAFVFFFCAFCNLLEYKMRTTKFYRQALGRSCIWGTIGLLIIIW